MITTTEGEPAPSSPHAYFVDETGDGVIFDGKSRVLIGTAKVQEDFTVGMVECWALKALTEDLAALRAQLLADPYFKGVPSLQPEAQKTARFFHGKDDLPEVRREVFKVLARDDFSFYAVVRTMSAVARRGQRSTRVYLRPPGSCITSEIQASGGPSNRPGRCHVGPDVKPACRIQWDPRG